MRSHLIDIREARRLKRSAARASIRSLRAIPYHPVCANKERGQVLMMGRVGRVLPRGCHPAPPRTGLADFPASGSSAWIQADWTKRIEMPPNADGRPAHPVESANKLLPRVAVALAASVQPFKQQPFELGSEGLTPPSIVGDGVIIKVALQSTFGLTEQQPRFGFMTSATNPVFNVP